MDRVVIGLSPAELSVRARALRLVVTDVDGVLTDTGVYYSERGEELKRFSVRDGMGMELLRDEGIATAFLTREETSGAVRARAAKVKAALVYLGVRDKLAFLPRVLADSGLTIAEVGFIGDDVNDVPLLRALSETGLTAAPADAMPAARDAALYRASAPGGYGAFRDFADWILALRK